MWCYLCMDCHTGSRGVHTTKDGQQYWLRLKQKTQRIYEQEHTREEFIKEFGRSYL